MKNDFVCSRDFDMFKSNVCHELKRFRDDELFIATIFKEDRISQCWNNEKYLEALYYYSLIDYLRRVNNLNFNMPYEKLKDVKLKKVVLPTEVIMVDDLDKNYDYPTCKACIKDSLPEFIKHNIAECEVRNVA